MRAGAVGRAAFVVALAVVTAGCVGVRPTLGEPVAGGAGAAVGGRVAVVGDSLTVGQYATLPVAAEARGIRLDISAEFGRGVAAGVPELRRLAPGHHVVVVALGTNDAVAGLTAERAGALIDASLAAVAADATVLWPTVHRAPGTAAGEAAAVFNAALHRASQRHAGLVVVDWAAVVAARPDLADPDGIHLTADGYAVRTAWLVDHIVDRLGAAVP